MLQPGESLAHYRIDALLGRGGMGAVYKATDEALGRTVALKVVLPEHTNDERYLKRFQTEARAAASLHHPNVASILAVGRERDLTFLVLEFVPGGSLADRLAREGRLAWREAAARGAEVARGLASIHEAKLVHRDLKPHNVLIDGEGRSKIADFGIVKRTTPASASTAGSGTGDHLLGSLEYMPPEQQGDAQVDARADLYALGATLHHLIAGKPPFQGSPVALLKQHLLDRPPPLRKLVPDVPRELEALVLRLLEKEPARRGGSALEVALELEAIAAGRSTTKRALWALVAIPGLTVAVVAVLIARASSPAVRQAPRARGEIVARIALPETEPLGRVSVDRASGHVLLGGQMDRRVTFLIDPVRGTQRRVEGAASLSGAVFHPTKSIFFGSTGRSAMETRAFTYTPGVDPTVLWTCSRAAQDEKFPGGTFDLDPGTNLLYEVTSFGSQRDTVYVHDAVKGKLVAARRARGWAENVVVDPVSHRAYVSRGSGEWHAWQRRHVSVIGPPPALEEEPEVPDLIALAADPPRSRVLFRRRHELFVLSSGELKATGVNAIQSLAVDASDGRLYLPGTDEILVHATDLAKESSLAVAGAWAGCELAVDPERRLLHIYVPIRGHILHSFVTVSLGETPGRK